MCEHKCFKTVFGVQDPSLLAQPKQTERVEGDKKKPKTPLYPANKKENQMLLRTHCQNFSLINQKIVADRKKSKKLKKIKTIAMQSFFHTVILGSYQHHANIPYIWTFLSAPSCVQSTLYQISQHIRLPLIQDLLEFLCWK